MRSEISGFKKQKAGCLPSRRKCPCNAAIFLESKLQFLSFRKTVSGVPPKFTKSGQAVVPYLSIQAWPTEERGRVPLLSYRLRHTFSPVWRSSFKEMGAYKGAHFLDDFFLRLATFRHAEHLFCVKNPEPVSPTMGFYDFICRNIGFLSCPIALQLEKVLH